MSRKTREMLERLAAVAALKRQTELARLAAVAQSRNRLQAAIAAVSRVEAPLDAPADDGAGVALPTTDPAMVRARLAHARWSEAQRRRLNQQLARVLADYHAQHPAAARAFGRAQVLETLAQRAARPRPDRP